MNPTAWHESRSMPVTESGCWLWLGAAFTNGYGHVHVGGRHTSAHRHSYELIHGRQERSVDICHKCDTRLCINPDHLFVGTRKENINDAKKKNRLCVGIARAALQCGERGHNAKLTFSQVAEIRSDLDSGMLPSAIACKFNVSTENIRKIRAGDTWKKDYPCKLNNKDNKS